MALFNYATKEITLKIVYYGPGLSGKTTNLQHLHSVLNASSKGKLLSLSTEADRTLFFDFLPVELGKIRDFSIRFQLYTVPGQVRYNATRKIVLKGADAVVFVADSQREMREQNIESRDDMKENLLANNINPEEIPIVFQYNKRDLKDIASVEELNRDLNAGNHPVIEGIAINGTGVEEGFKLISRLLLRHISTKHKIEVEPVEERKETPRPSALEEPLPVGPDLKTPVTPPPFPEAAEPDFDQVPKKRAFEVEPVEDKEERKETPRPSALEEPLPGGPDLKTPVTPPPRQPFREETESLIRHDEGVSGLRSHRTDFRSRMDKAERFGAGNEAVPISPKSIEKITGELEKIQETLKSMKDSFSVMSNELKALAEIKKTQGETSNMLRHIKDLLANLKTARRWFKF